ncbi:hypothetical protein BGW37DRAFT_439500 [Umbelopsis sp. PMI_123]|nr:hypothetical protein BGW37DRAFT_439500 [Umbelopsis sp. PMI_123]
MPVHHPSAKQLLAGIAAVEVDKLFETKGLNFINRDKAKHQARRNAEKLMSKKKNNNYRIVAFTLLSSHVPVI